MTAPSTLADLRFRRPTEADHRTIVGLVDEWWGGRRIHHLLPRLWFQHFTGTSWLAETEAGRPMGFLVGFISPDDPSIAYIHMIGIDPSVRRRGLGRELYRRFFYDVGARGVVRVRAITWPGNRLSVGFHTGLGFQPIDGPGSQNLYGTLAFADYDFQGDDRAVFERRLTAPDERQ
jgi:ribosomal protein S18 acetylase RimI-like enzyme